MLQAVLVLFALQSCLVEADRRFRGRHACLTDLHAFVCFADLDSNFLAQRSKSSFSLSVCDLGLSIVGPSFIISNGNSKSKPHGITQIFPADQAVQRIPEPAFLDADNWRIEQAGGEIP